MGWRLSEPRDRACGLNGGQSPPYELKAVEPRTTKHVKGAKMRTTATRRHNAGLILCLCVSVVGLLVCGCSLHLHLHVGGREVTETIEIDDPVAAPPELILEVPDDGTVRGDRQGD